MNSFSQIKETFLVSILLITFFSLSCSSQIPSSKWNEVEIRGRNVIIFIPGLYGSALSERKTGDKVFHTFNQALWGSIPLALNGATLGISDSKELNAESILQDVTVVPWLYSVDVYGNSVEYLQNQFGKNATVIPFYYDWRDDDSIAVQALAKQVRALRKAGANRIALIGHSLGGMLTAFYLRYGETELQNASENWEGTEFVDIAVIAGAPFSGALASFRDLLLGTSLGLAKTPLSALSLGTFPSFYQFIPRIQTESFLNSSLKSIGESFYEIENWMHWKMGLYSQTEKTADSILQKRKEYTLASIKTGRRFSDLLCAPIKKSTIKHTPVLLISGSGVPTQAKAVWTGETLTASGNWIFNSEELKKINPNQKMAFTTDGDGLVTLHSAKLPDAYYKNLKVESITLPTAHRGMFTEKIVQDKVTSFLILNGFYLN